MKYIILVLWTFSLFLLMFSSFPFRVECRPTRAMGPGPPYLPGAGASSPQQQHQYSSTSALGVRATGGGRFGFSSTQSCPVLEGPGASASSAGLKPANLWPELYSIDVTEKFWDTQLVLEGMARSRSEVRSDGTYGVTFDLIRVVKGDAPLLRRRKQFRLQFLDNPSAPGNGGANNQTGSGSSIISSSPSSRSSSSGAGAGSINGVSHRSNPFLTSTGSSSSSSHHHSSQQHHLNNYNRALGLRSNTPLSNQSPRNSQIITGGIPIPSSSSSSGGRTIPNGAISLKSSNLHSNYVLQHQQQQQLLTQRRNSLLAGSSSSSSSSGRSSLPPRGNLTIISGRNSNFNFNNNNLNLNNLNLRNSNSNNNQQSVQQHQHQQYLRNLRGLNLNSPPLANQNYSSSVSARNARRVPRSSQNSGAGSGGRHHGRRHGRAMGPRSSSVVNSGSGGGGGGGGGKCLPPRATVKTGRKYFVFAAKVENHFVAVFSPELANKRNTKAVESILCKGCGQAPSLVAQKEAVLQPKERLRLRCRLRAGNPIPVLTWYKDGRLVNLTDPRYRLRSKRRQSVLVIRRAKEVDTGVYKCEAKNAFGSAHAMTKVSLGAPSSSSSSSSAASSTPQKPPKPPSPKPVGTTPTTRWNVPSSVCPFDSYCLNGGNCSYYESIGEYVCQCAEGYKGQRCDTKDIPNSGSYLSYFCIFGTNNPDYPC